jgi:hypothetical protein
MLSPSLTAFRSQEIHRWRFNFFGESESRVAMGKRGCGLPEGGLGRAGLQGAGCLCWQVTLVATPGDLRALQSPGTLDADLGCPAGLVGIGSDGGY